jgi:hypothetical protein
MLPQVVIRGITNTRNILFPEAREINVAINEQRLNKYLNCCFDISWPDVFLLQNNTLHNSAEISPLSFCHM